MNDQPDSQPDNPGQPRAPINPAGTSSAPPPPPGYVPAVFVAQPSGKSAAGKFMMYVLCVLLLFSVTANVYLWKVIPQFAAVFGGGGGLQEVRYNPEIQPSDLEDRVVVVTIDGAIDGGTAAYARQAFYQLQKDPPSAVVLRINSGGGGVTASDQIWHAIKEFQATHENVPVIASFGGIAASGGYYIAAPCDYIFCERTGITGSIGVLAQVPAAGGMIEKVGLEMNMVIADQSPSKDDANNLFIQWYDEQGNLTQEGEEAVKVLKNLLNDAYDTFLGVVVEGRTAADNAITKEQLEAAANGSIFIGIEAVEAKLVDKIGYLDDAIEHAAQQAGISGEPNITVISKPAGFRLGLLLGEREGADLTNVTGEDLKQLADDFTAVRLEYRTRLR